MIVTKALTRRYGDHLALDGLDLRVEEGEIMGLLGPNGAGKTTTVKLLTGMLRPSSGQALVAGFDVVERPLEVKRRIGFIPENAPLYENLTPQEFLDLMACLYHLPEADAAGRIDELLEIFDLASVRHRRMVEFSKGMKQKVVFSAALLHRPAVLLLDEPLNGLDVGAAGLVKDMLEKLASRGRTILFCSHVLEVVERICSRVTILGGGRVIAKGKVDEVVTATGSRDLEQAFESLTGARPRAPEGATVLE